MPQIQQMGPTDLQLAGKLGGRSSLGEPAQNQDDLGWTAVRSLQGRPGEQVEDPATGPAPEVDDGRVGTTRVTDQLVTRLATWASQAVGVEKVQKKLVASLFVHQAGDREVHFAASWGEVRSRPDHTPQEKANH